MAKKTNCIINGKEYYRIYRKVGKKLNKYGIWADEYKNFYGSCKSEAEKAYNDYLKQKQSGTLDKCLGELIDDWLVNVFSASSLADSTKLRYRSAYERCFRCKPISGRKISEVSSIDLQKHYNELNAPTSTVKALHNLLRRFYKYAQINGICQDITTCLDVPKKPQNKPVTDLKYNIEVWEDEDLKRIIAALEGSTLRLLIVLAANTGARYSELLALTYDDIKDNTLTINKQLTEVPDSPKGKYIPHISTTKTSGSNRIIPLSAAVVEEINKHKKLHKAEMMKNGYRTNNIFTTSNGNYLYKRNVSLSLIRLYRRIGVPYHKFHTYRHTFGTNLSRAGVPIEETARLMGHSNINVTAKYYINISEERKLEAVEKITSFSL